MQPLHLDAHDLALWLFDNLESVSANGAGGRVGRLPDKFNFAEIEQLLQGYGTLHGYLDPIERSIEFFPASANVFETLDELLAVPLNRERIPNKFTIRSLNYASSKDTQQQPEVDSYKAAATFSGALKGLADVVLPDSSLLFVKSHAERLRMQLDYGVADLSAIPRLDDFVENFFDTEHHKDQKRAVIRQSILDIFKGQTDVNLSQLLVKLNDFQESARASYAMYMAEFTLEKVKAEIEKDNLDSAVKLGKAVSDIQNQILAMPAALLLIGGQMEATNAVGVKNLTLLIGALIFTWFMDVLIGNQRRTLDSIEQEVSVRRKKVADQPPQIVDLYKDSFDDLASRLRSQRCTLRKIRLLVALGLVISCSLFSWASFDSVRSMVHNYLAL